MASFILPYARDRWALTMKKFVFSLFKSFWKVNKNLTTGLKPLFLSIELKLVMKFLK